MIYQKEFLNYILFEHVSLFNLSCFVFQFFVNERTWWKLCQKPVVCTKIRDRPFNLKWGLCFRSEPDLFHSKPKSDYFVALDMKNLSFYFNFHQHLSLKTRGSAYLFFACCSSIHFFHKIWEQFFSTITDRYFS